MQGINYKKYLENEIELAFINDKDDMELKLS